MMRSHVRETTFLFRTLLLLALVVSQASCKRLCPDCPDQCTQQQSPLPAPSCETPSEARNCQEFSPGGWGYSNHVFLEGRGLEQIYFTSESGTVKFPPDPGTVLTAASECGKPKLSVKVSKCAADNHGASACVVDVQTKNGICSAGVPRVEDTKNHRGVIMVRGSWDKSGTWADDGTKFTLSCDANGGIDQALSADGAITACIRSHRYAPQSNPNEFQACIRAVRADYCGDGTAHTRSGTDIDVFDTTLTKMTKSDCSDGRAFEASWTPAGAVCIAHLRWAGSPSKQPPCPNMGPAANGRQCLTSPPTPVVTTRSNSHSCNGTIEVVTPATETDSICKS